MALIGAAVLISAAINLRRARADEDDEKPIVSNAARVSRDAAGRIVISIPPATRREIRLVTEVLTPIARPAAAEAYGVVLDPAPLSKLNSDVVVAQAALDASRAQFRRTSRLYAEQKNESLRNLQTAQAAYLADQARLEALRQQLRDGWGGEIAMAPARSRAALVGALIDRREAIARVTVPIGETFDGLPATAQVAVLGHEERAVIAKAIYFAPTADPKMQGQSFLLLVDAAGFPVRPGSAVSAALASGQGAHGVMAPRSAVVQYEGKEWVYQALDPDRFTRREIVAAAISTDGYFVEHELKPGMRIVVAGAQTILSEELKGQIEPED